MPILEFTFNKLTAEKNSPILSQVNIKNNIKLSDVQLVKVPVDNKERELLRVDFQFDVEYEKIGNINTSGYLLYIDEPEKLREAASTWKKNKKIEKELSTHILNYILIKCNIKALELSQQVNLPPHIQLPLLKVAEKKK